MLPSSNITCRSPCCPGITFLPESYKKQATLKNKTTWGDNKWWKETYDVYCPSFVYIHIVRLAEAIN
jgi:hypothetical protein